MRYITLFFILTYQVVAAQTMQIIYMTEHIQYGAMHKHAGIPDIKLDPKFQATLDQKGKEGFELIQIVPFNYTDLNTNKSYAVRLVFKKAQSENDAYLKYLANRIDSIADNYAKKEIIKAKTELISLLDESTKNIYSVELKKQIYELFDQMLKEQMEKLKREIVENLKNKR